MWPFQQYRENRRIRDLEERLETIERSHKALLLEWEDSYDRLRRMMGRVAKRALKDEAPSEADSQMPLSADGAEGSSQGRFLTPRQRALQQQILRRRAGT